MRPAVSTERVARVLGCLAAMAALCVQALHAWTTWTDDAYISFRYGRNLLAGEGLVFNPGERVEGITNLAWAVLLAPATDGDPMFVAKGIGLACSLATLAALAVWADAEDLHPVAALLAMAPFALLPWAPFWAVQGLETPAVALLVTLGWTRYAVEVRTPGKWPLAALALGLAPAFRPDAALLAPLVGLVHLSRPGPRDTPHVRRSVGIVLACAAALVTFKLAWFGAVLPHTFAVKAVP